MSGSLDYNGNPALLCCHATDSPDVVHRILRLIIERQTKMHSFCLVVLSCLASRAYADAIDVNLGTADSFAVLGGSTVTNTGDSVIDGNLGVWPGSAITGFPPGSVSGTIYTDDATSKGAQTDLTTAYNFAAGEACPGTNVLTSENLGGMTLTPGVYCFASSAQLTGTLTLNALGNPNAVFLFQIGSTLTTASASSVDLINAGSGDNVFWQIGSSATLGTATEFEGNILALTSITMNTGANIGCGRALARNGAVTLDTNDVSIATAGCEVSTGNTVPEPVTAPLLGMGLLLTIIVSWRQSQNTHGSRHE